MILDVPQTSAADTPIAITVRGAQPRAMLNLTLETKDAQGNTWASNVFCRADGGGTIVVQHCAPQSGSSYANADAMGLFWSMKAMGTPPALFEVPDAASEAFTLKAFDGSKEVASKTFARVYAAPGVTRLALNDNVVGNAYIPAGAGKHPAVILLGGSGGGHPMDALAALLASRGYVTLSLAYFRGTNLPDILVNIPIETVGRGIAWLKARKDVDASHIAVIGHSRGSELALLSGAYYSDIKAVVALAPSPMVWAGINPKDYMHPQSAWTYDGKPLPFVPADPTAYAQMKNDPATGFSLLPLFQGSLHNAQTTPDAWIPIERTHGPILFVAGESDAMWPSETMAQMGIQRLHDKHHAYHDAMLTFPNAGHWMFESYIPEDGRIKLNSAQMPFAFGGTPAGDAAAAARAWPAIVSFLNTTLK